MASGVRTAVIGAVIGVLIGTLLATAPTHGQSTSIIQQVLQRGTLRIATTAGNPPYESAGPNGPVGYDIDIAKMVAAALKVKPEFTITDGAGRIAMLQTRKADITVANFTRTVERSTTIAFTDPYLVVHLHFLVLANRSDLNTLTDVDTPKVKIAIGRGGTAEFWVPAAVPHATVVRYNQLTDMYLALQNHQVDAMSQDDLYNATQMKKNPGKFKVIPGNYSIREELSIGLPAGDVDWLRVLNLWVEQFNNGGDNAKLFQQWVGFDFSQFKP